MENIHVFCHFLAPFGLPKWSQKCSKIRVKSHPGPQRAPRELPRVPKEPPRPPKVSKSPPPGTLRGSILVHFGSILDPSGTFLAPLSAILVLCVSGLGCRVRGTLQVFSWFGPAGFPKGLESFSNNFRQSNILRRNNQIQHFCYESRSLKNDFR